MESGKTKSQPSLLPRRVSYTDLQATALPRTQSLYSKHSLASTAATMATNLPAITSRPGSSRPGSRPTSRMESRITSRPPSRMMDRQQQQQHQQQQTDPVQRPRSAIRPLSSRVFMRRTDRGWVAKHYPEQPSTSNLELEGDLSDCESLDSFFNEDFDDQEHSEKLGNLLTCNTLGVESKGQKKDWNAGDVGIPKFHCPRCRDHWYGLTPFPCDEELERLIREGLWYTGKGDPRKIPPRKQSVGHSGLPDNDESRTGTSSVSAVGKNEKGRVLKGGGQSGSQVSWGVGGEEEEVKKKSKRRITFKLDDEEDQGRERRSGYSEDGGDGGTRSKRGEGDGKGTNHASLSNGENSDLESFLNSTDKSNEASSTGLGSAGNLLDRASPTGKRPSRIGGLDSDNSGLLEGSGSNDSLTNRRKRRGKKGKEGDTQTGRGASRKQGVKGGGSKTQLYEVGMGLANVLADKPGASVRETKRDSSRSESSGSQVHMENGGDATGQGDETAKGAQISSRRGSQSSSITSAQAISSERGPDHGRKVRKAVGYMRAVSPTGSEWGDPSHARPYASSTTASSRAGSTFALPQNEESEDTVTSTLPPLIPPIVNKQKPLVDLSDLMGGFQLTKAWTFSYHNAIPLSRPTSVANARAGRRK